MASLIAGFDYDIFISYRQKDNKYDGWVTEFVDHLKRELDATFKEDISVYFDENPHDGLLETHDVDASLRDKLKCLVFIPVVSRTYCDPRSFAWEHEFKAFIKQASEDRFGLKVALPGSNTSSRILPVRINDLDPEDRALIEGELGGPLRAIDFIYREPGVNRPLSPGDDQRKNLNNTLYRNQINKTANAIKEILNGLVARSAVQPANEGSPENVSAPPYFRSMPVKSLWKSTEVIRWLGALLIIASLMIVYRIIRNGMQAKEVTRLEKTIAVLPFENMTNDSELAFFGDAMTDEIIMQLYKIRQFTVRNMNSVRKYKGTTLDNTAIGQELKVNFLITGSTQIIDDQVKIRVQLINAANDALLWGDTFESDWAHISSVQGEIARQTAAILQTVLTAEEKNQIDKDPTKDPDAYKNYLSANVSSNNAAYFFITGSMFADSSSFASAIAMYDKAISFDTSFALAYAKRAIARSWGFYTGQLDSIQITLCKKDIDKALSLDPDLAEAQTALGFYYYYCLKDNQKALTAFRTASAINPDNYQPLFYMAMVYRKLGEWNKSKELILKVLKSDPRDALVLTNIGISYLYMHQYDSAIYFQDKAIDVMPGWSAPYQNKVFPLLYKHGETSMARAVIDTAVRRTGRAFTRTLTTLDIYDGNYDRALERVEQNSASVFGGQGERYLILAEINDLLGKKTTAMRLYDSALVSLREMISGQAASTDAYSSLGIAYAGLGDRTRAVEAGRKAVTMASGEIIEENDAMISLAQIYTMTGDYDKSLEIIEHLLQKPSGYGAELFNLDPVWKPLRNLPEYTDLINRYLYN